MKTAHVAGRSSVVDAPVEIALPSTARNRNLPKGRSVALVDVEGQLLRLRFVRTSLLETPPAMLSQAEQDVLTAGGVGPVSRERVQVAEALGAVAYQRLLDTTVTVEEAAERLNVNQSRIRQRLVERSLYGIKDGHTWRLPAFQFDRTGLVPGIDVVLRALPADIGPVAVARWLAAPNPDLCTRDREERPLAPLQWLLSGNPPEAAAALAAVL
jgi:excisionase family DNA binding protein